MQYIQTKSAQKKRIYEQNLRQRRNITRQITGSGVQSGRNLSFGIPV